MDPVDDRLSSGAWKVAEQRAQARGVPLPRRTAGAATGLEAQVGLPNRIERLLRIERETERLERRLARAYAELAQERAGDPLGFPDAWRRRIRSMSFLEVNELVAEHNEWFPIEARLRWDLAAGDFRAPFGLPWRKQHLDVAWALERFPADLSTAVERRGAEPGSS